LHDELFAVNFPLVEQLCVEAGLRVFL
jgi:hypothetical protein